MTDNEMFQKNQKQKKTKVTPKSIFPGNIKMQEAVQELIDMSRGHDKLAWEDILNPPNAGVSAYHTQAIARILLDPHTGGSPKVWQMSNVSIMMFCGILLQNLWFNGGLFELNMVRHLIPRWDRQLNELEQKAKKEQKDETNSNV